MSAILSNVMDNTVFVESFDMVILVSSMWFGWFAFSSVLRFVTERHWRQHLRTKIADADASMSEVCTGTLVPDPDSIEDFHPCAVDEAQKVRCLLESYGVLGASPGAWVSSAGLELDTASETSIEADGEYEGADSDLDWDPAQESGSVFPAVAGTKSNLGMLFEHYALFQSEPGTWCPAQGEDSDETSEESMEDTADGCDDLLSGSNVSSLPESHVLVDVCQGTLANGGCALKACSSDEADVLVEGPLEGLVDPPRKDVIRALFEQYSLFGAEPGTWSKDSDCSTSYSSESESAEAAEDITSDVNSDAMVDDYSKDWVEQ